MKKSQNIMKIIVGPNVTEITKNFIETVKRKKLKGHVRKPPTLQNIATLQVFL